VAGVQSSVGLISGIDYVSLVNQLIAVDAAPRDNLQVRTDALKAQEDALAALSIMFQTAAYMIANLNKPEPFNRCDVSTSNDSLLKAVKNGSPVQGTYSFTPIQLAATQQTIAQGVSSDSTPLGKTGTITIGKTWNLGKNVDLSTINGGQGMAKGQIRITDGSGTRAVIDLRSAITMQDVVDTINNTNEIDVQASLDGDHLVLTDLSGGDPSKFIVQETAGGSTAASLGIAGLTLDGSGQAAGQSIYKIGEKTSLSTLNDGNGIVTDPLWADMVFTCKDGSTVTVDFNYRSTQAEIDAGAPEFKKELSIGDLINTVNNSPDANGNTGKIIASISADGRGLVFTDTSEGAGSTTLTQPATTANPVLRSLGLTSGNETSLTAADGVFQTRNLIGTLDSPLMASMNGGMGLSAATAGEIQVQDRAGNAATLSFTDEELGMIQTLNDAVYILNQKLSGTGVGLNVSLNDAKTALQLTDTTGSTSSAIIFRDKTTVTETTTVNEETGEEETTSTTTSPNIASSFGLNINAAQSQVSGDSLKMQVVSANTKLSSMNGGKGVTMSGGKIILTDSLGQKAEITVDPKRVQTVGDVINAINSQSTKILARINDAGDGILLEDYGNGEKSFQVMDDNVSKFCADLGIAGTGNINNKVNGRQQINAAASYSIEVLETDSLDSIRQKINDVKGNFTASIVSDGSDTPFRLAISGNSTGAAAGFNIDLSCLGLTTENMTEAKDAKLVYGDAKSSGGLVMSSGTNTFKGIINGVDLTVTGTSEEPVTVSSEKSSIDIKVSLQAFVDNYNAFKEKWAEQTAYVDVSTASGNVLTFNMAAKQFDRVMSDALLKRIYDVPGINSLQSLGISIEPVQYDEETGAVISKGLLKFDETVFESLYESNPDGIRDFFYRATETTDANGEKTTTKYGWAQKFADAANSLTDPDYGIVSRELTTLGRKIDSSEERITFLTDRLAVKRQQMLNKFYIMEQAMAKMSSDMSTVSGIASMWSSNSTSA
jgi:flagellar hook-associated protein 2